MYDDITVESLKTAILTNLAAAGWNTGEGSTAELLAGPMATEVWKRYQADSALVPMFYIDETSGPYIDRMAQLLGLEHKSGAKAGAELSLSGIAGTRVPAGTLFLTADGLEFGLDADVVLDEEGSGTGHITASTVGAAYNIDAGEVVRMYINLAGLTGYANEQAVGGVDPESDGALSDRVLTRLRRPPTSNNVYHYEQMALEVDGVGVPKIFPLYEGPGSVGVVLADEDAKPVDQAVVEAVAAHIAEDRIIGPSVTVKSAEGVAITVAAEAQIDSTTTVETVQAAFVSNLDTYLTGLAKETWPSAAGDYTVLYNRIAALLLTIPGVVDYTALTVNGAQANVTLGPEQVPVLGEVTVT